MEQSQCYEDNVTGRAVIHAQSLETEYWLSGMIQTFKLSFR